MTDLNCINVVGRLVRGMADDPSKFSYLQSGVAKASISIACNSSRKNSQGEWEEEASYFDVEIFGKVAENLKPYLNKGQQVAISGKLKQSRWEKDGIKHSKVYILADTVQLIGGKNENVSNTGANQSSFKPIENVHNDNPMNYVDANEIPF